MVNLLSRRRWLVVFLYLVCQLNGLELRRKRLLRSIRGGYENEDYFDGNYGFFRPPEAESEEKEEAEEERVVPQVRRYEAYEPPIPVYVSSGGGGLVTLVMALTATLAGGIVWFLKSQGTTPQAKTSESMYAETVASLEAQLHRLSVDRQMLADEFDQARTSLEQQIATATAAAEASRSETAAALEEADRATRQARAAADTLSERLKSEIALAERLREDKLRAESELDRLRRRHQRRARTSTSSAQSRHIPIYEKEAESPQPVLSQQDTTYSAAAANTPSRPSPPITETRKVEAIPQVSQSAEKANNLIPNDVPEQSKPAAASGSTEELVRFHQRPHILSQSHPRKNYISTCIPRRRSHSSVESSKSLKNSSKAYLNLISILIVFALRLFRIFVNSLLAFFRHYMNKKSTPSPTPMPRALAAFVENSN